MKDNSCALFCGLSGIFKYLASLGAVYMEFLIIGILYSRSQPKIFLCRYRAGIQTLIFRV